MPDLSTPAPTPTALDELDRKFTSSPAKIQLQLIPQILATELPGIELLINWLTAHKDEPPSIVSGAVYQSLYDSPYQVASEYLDREWPTGAVPLQSSMGVDYTQLQKLLADRQWEAADKLTTEKLCELAGADAIARKWIYFTEVERLPAIDLQTIDLLWLCHSEGKFGFSVQREMWLGMGKNWDKLWPKIGWKQANNWTRYPGSFTWDLSAPRGHLPLSNQLRGVRVISSLLSHPAWEQSK